MEESNQQTVTPDSVTGGAQSRIEREAQGPLPDAFSDSELEKARKADLEPKQDLAVQEEKEAASQEEQEQEQEQEQSKIPDLANLPKKAQDWKALKDGHKAEVSALRAEIEQLKASPNEELETLRKQVDEYKTALRETALERDPEFNAKFNTQRDVAVRAAKMAAGEKGEALGKLLEMPDSAFRDEQIDKLMEDLPSSAQRRIGAAVTTLTQIEIGRQTEIEASKQNWDARLQAEQQQQTQQQTRELQERQQVFEGMLKQLQEPGDKGYFAYQAGNSEAAESIELAKRVINNDLSPQELAQAALHVGASKQLLSLATQQQNEIESLTKKLAEYEAAVPGNGTVEPAAKDLKQKNYFSKGYDNDFMAGLKAAQKAG